MMIDRIPSAGATVELKLIGRLNSAGRTSFRKSIKDAWAACASSIILDMEQVSDIDTAGLGLLLLAYEELSRVGISFNLSHPQGRVLKLLNFAKISELIPILEE